MKIKKATKIGGVVLGAALSCAVIYEAGVGIINSFERNRIELQQEQVVKAERVSKAKSRYDAMWRESSQEITGTVVERRYGTELTQGRDSDGDRVALMDPYCDLKIQTNNFPEKIIAINVIDSRTHDNRSLCMLAEEGKRVSFPRGNIYKTEPVGWNGKSMGDFGYREDNSETFFQDDTQTGSKRADNIRIVPLLEK